MKNLFICLILLLQSGMLLAQNRIEKNITFHEIQAAQADKDTATASSFIKQFPSIEKGIRELYDTEVFRTRCNPDFNMADICTAGFLKRLSDANDYDGGGYATWLLRSGMQDGDDTPSQVLSVLPAAGNTVIVNWSDMGHKGSTVFTMVESDGGWKIDNASVPD